jgi:hypothetical protein
VKSLKLLILSALLLAAAGLAQASSYIEVTLPNGDLNSNLLTWTDGSAYTGLFGNTYTFNGVPFTFAQNPTNGYNIIELGGYNSVTMPVANVGTAYSVYTLINSAWGAAGTTIGYLTFVDTRGDRYKVALVEGSDVRDHYYNPNPYVNTLSNQTAGVTTSLVYGSPYFTQAPGYAHLDEQYIPLPSEFQTYGLADIIFQAHNGGCCQGEPFIAAATVDGSFVSTPEPSSLLLFGSGLAGFASLLRRKLKA